MQCRSFTQHNVMTVTSTPRAGQLQQRISASAVHLARIRASSTQPAAALGCLHGLTGDYFTAPTLPSTYGVSYGLSSGDTTRSA